MPASWTRMLDVRTWTALTEENWQRSAAAWAWLKNYTLSRRGGSLPALSLKDGLWSRLVPSHVILCQGEGGQAYASLGNATWASLTWPLNESGRTPDGLPMFQWSRGPTAWLYVTSPSEWFVIPSVAVRIRTGMVLRATGSAEPLMKYSLSHTNNLNFEDLKRCCEFLELDVANKRTVSELLAALAQHFSPGTNHTHHCSSSLWPK